MFVLQLVFSILYSLEDKNYYFQSNGHVRCTGNDLPDTNYKPLSAYEQFYLENYPELYTIFEKYFALIREMLKCDPDKRFSSGKYSL